jgi:hypothetical protein
MCRSAPRTAQFPDFVPVKKLAESWAPRSWNYRVLICLLHDRLERLGGAVRENLREHQKIAQTAEVMAVRGLVACKEEFFTS